MRHPARPAALLATLLASSALWHFTEAITVVRRPGVQYKDGITVLPREGASGPAPVTAATALSNYGGITMHGLQIVPVYWTSAVSYRGNLYYLYAGLAAGPFINFLHQYSTPAQTIVDGSVPAQFVGSQTATTVTDGDIQAYLISLFAGRKVPLPTGNTYYPVHFPPGVTVKDSNGLTSCVEFCAYHSTFMYNGVIVPYGAVVDMGSGGCQAGCGPWDAPNNLFIASTHELAEVIVDPLGSRASCYAFPLGWYSPDNGDIGDICNHQGTAATLPTGRYGVQKLWSNLHGACVTPTAATPL